MQVVPVTLMGLLAAVGLGPWLGATRTRRVLAAGVAVAASALWLHDGIHLAQRAERALR